MSTKINFLWFLTIMIVSPAFSQKIEPRVIILYPHETIVSEKIREDLKEYESETEITEALKKNYVREDLAESWKIIRTKELEFIEKQDFFSLLPFTTSTNLIYMLYEFHEFPLVYPVRESSVADGNSMKALADKYEAEWVVNFLSAELTEGTDRTAKVKIQLYNALTQRTFLTREYVGNSANPGGNLACEDGSWDCTVNNIVATALVDIFEKLEKNRHYRK